MAIRIPCNLHTLLAHTLALAYSDHADLKLSLVYTELLAGNLNFPVSWLVKVNALSILVGDTMIRAACIWKGHIIYHSNFFS